MAFCKICGVCGEKVVFPSPLAFPGKCPSCGSDLNAFLTYREDDPEVEELLRQQREPPEKPTPARTAAKGPARYALRMRGAAGSVAIPPEGCVVGRLGAGGELLAGCGSVSREHFRVKPHRAHGVFIEDMSRYGTWLDGRQLEKGVPALAAPGAAIRVPGAEFVLEMREDEL